MKLAKCHPEKKHYGRGLCQSCYDVKRYYDNIDKQRARVREYNRTHREEKIRYIKQWRIDNAAHIAQYAKTYKVDNADQIKASFKKYRKENRSKVLLWRKKSRTRYYSDLNYKMYVLLTTRFRLAFKSQSINKSSHLVDILGCTIEQAKLHLESQFQPGMTWENHGEWHIDHIKPCASFDLTDPEEQKKCFHFSNLQPLWAEDNLLKGAKENYDLAS